MDQDHQIINFLTTCEDLLNSGLDQQQLEQLASQLIDTFFSFLEMFQEYKKETQFQKKLQQDEIIMLKQQLQSQILHNDEQKEDLNKQIEICSQLEMQLQNLECVTEQEREDIIKVESELRKNLYSQIQQLRDQIQTLTQLIIDKEQQGFSLQNELKQYQFNLQQYEKKILEQQFIINDLNSILENQKENLSAMAPTKADLPCQFMSQKSMDIRHKRRIIYSNQVSNNIINMNGEKLQPSLGSFRNSFTIINPVNTINHIQSQQNLKFIDNCDYKCDPYWEFFKLLTQSAKLNLHKPWVFTLNLDYLFDQFKTEGIPFNKWYSKIIDEILS